MRITPPALARKFVENKFKELRVLIGGKKVLLAQSGVVDCQLASVYGNRVLYDLTSVPMGIIEWE